MRPIINVEVVIAIHLKPFKLQEELLEDGLCLEGDDAVLVPLVLAIQHHAVHCLLNLGEKIALLALITQLVHLVWKLSYFDSSRHKVMKDSEVRI